MKFLCGVIELNKNGPQIIAFNLVCVDRDTSNERNLNSLKYRGVCNDRLKHAMRMKLQQACRLQNFIANVKQNQMCAEYHEAWQMCLQA